MRKIEQGGLTLIRLADAAPPPADWGYAFPAHAAEAEDAARKRWAPDGRFHTEFAIHLVIAGGSIALIDAGIGPGPVGYFGGLEGHLMAELARIGLSPGDVNSVMLTHLHLDHVGWASQDGRACFPNAHYLMPTVELEHWSRTGASAALPHHVAAFDIHVAPLLAQGLLTGLEAGAPAPGTPMLRFLPVPGHTAGHAAVVSADEALIVAGDAWHSPAQIARPDWCHRADRDPAQAVRSRVGLARLAAGRGALVAAGHFPPDVAFGHVVQGPDAEFRWQPIGQSVQ